MNVKYLAKNPTPVTQTITLRQGLPIGDSGVRSTEAVTVQVPPMSVREILFNENGTPLIEGCVQDLTVTLENEEGTPIDPHSSRRERTTIRNIDGERTDVFVEQARRVYPGLDVETARNLGGTQLLAQFSHLRSARDNTTAIYSPAALNMSFESRVDSVYHAAESCLLVFDVQAVIPSDSHRRDAHGREQEGACIIAGLAMERPRMWQARVHLNAMEAKVHVPFVLCLLDMLETPAWALMLLMFVWSQHL